MLNFYDFEVTKYDWLVVIINPIERTKTEIVNDRQQLEDYYNKHKDEIFVGYNNNHYDQYIYKGIMCEFNPKEINDWIIVKDMAGWRFSDLLRKFPMYNYDVMLEADGGLKSLEGFMGNNIHESSIPFDIDRKLTPAEIAEMLKYCTHDVEQTIEAFLNRKESFDAIMSLIKAFKLPLSDVSRTETQLAAKILGATRQEYDDEFEICFPDTLRLKKYRYVYEWFLNRENRRYTKEIIGKNGKKRTVKNCLETTIAGVPHVFAWGGVHGALPKYIGKGYFLMIDVASLYPSLIIRYNLMSRSVTNPKRYEEIYMTNLRMKKEKNPLRPAYKLVCNKTYGGMKDKNNALYDPLMANNICIHGQLLLLDLIEHLEPYCQLIQSNTDGLLIKMREADTEANRNAFYAKIDEIVEEWENRTGLVMEFDEYTAVYQGDVNNYCAIPLGELYDEKGKPRWKSKGGYIKKLGKLDYDLPIINEALNAYMVHGTPIETTINNCNDLIKFQKIVKVSSKYMCGYHGSKRMNERCFRVFASTDRRDGIIGKQKSVGATIEKFANTPDHCYIVNGDVNTAKTDGRLDKEWYIRLATKRLREKFGVVA